MVTEIFRRYWFCRQKLILRTKRKIQVNHLLIPGNLACDYDSNNDESPPLKKFMGDQESKVWIAYAIINEGKKSYNSGIKMPRRFPRVICFDKGLSNFQGCQYHSTRVNCLGA